jgi:hypothetical protein
MKKIRTAKPSTIESLGTLTAIASVMFNAPLYAADDKSAPINLAPMEIIGKASLMDKVP